MNKLLLVTVLLSLSGLANAKVLAGKNSNVGNCIIKTEKLIFTKSNAEFIINQNLISEEYLVDIKTSIISGIGDRSIRWSPETTQYSIFEKVFNSHGFIKIPNHSEFSSALISDIDSACRINRHLAFGKFKIEVNINGNILKDYFEIKMQFGRLIAHYTFPEHFDEKLKEIKAEDKNLSFKFDLVEGNGPEKEITVEAEFISHDNITGFVIIDSVKHPFKGSRE
ncbi:MAG: hypothetical protein ACI9QD_000069 [Thermoproteota archaeon]|jgi:hypothetical protein